MKLIITGSTGFVGTELIRQALSNPAIKSIVGLARGVTAVPSNTGLDADPSKLKSVVCEDFGNYSESLQQELTGADACIWLLAITPSKSSKMPFEEVRKTCLDYTITGLQTISQLHRESSSTPMRFIYVSGAKAERDQSKEPWILGKYCLMRGETESLVLDYAKGSKGVVDACVTKPGLITAPGKAGVLMQGVQYIGRSVIGLPLVGVSEVAATLLDQAINGFEKETLLNDDLIRIGQKVLASEQGE